MARVTTIGRCGIPAGCRQDSNFPNPESQTDGDIGPGTEPSTPGCREERKRVFMTVHLQSALKESLAFLSGT